MKFSYTTDRVPFVSKDGVDLDMRLMGFSAVNPYARHNSSPRAAMAQKNLGQMLVVDKPDIRRISSGVDRELGRNTFSVDFDNNSVVLKSIPKFPQRLQMHNIKTNPLTIVVFENMDSSNLEVDIKEIPSHHTIHQYFGFDYKKSNRYNEFVRDGANIPAGTIVADSPNVDEYGNYRFGVNANAAFTSSPGGIEDGIIVSEEFLEKLTTTLYDSRTIEFGTGKIPLNLYGDEKSFKIFPDVGDRVAEDGIIAALREYDPELAPCHMTVDAMQKASIFDEKIYAVPGAEIIDVTIYCSNQSRVTMFTGMEGQLEKYLDAQTRFYEEIIKEYRRLVRETRGNLKISSQFHRLVKDAIAMTQTDRKITYTEKNSALDKWSVKITYKYKMRAGVGYKMTCLSG